MGVLNAAGFFDPLLAFFDHCETEGFVSGESRSIVVSSPTPDGLLAAMAAYRRPPPVIAGAASGWVALPSDVLQ